ncbi:MAG: DUF5076 domain-containing protein [Pseudomonadota bacterium]
MFWQKKEEGVSIQNPMLIALRVENAQETVSVHLDPEQLVNPGEAGVMHADIGRHMARALAQTSFDGSEEEAFHQIANIFNAEANAPTQPLKRGHVQ